MATIRLISPSEQHKELHPIEFKTNQATDIPPTVDFGAYMFDGKTGAKSLIRWPYWWVRYHATRNQLLAIVVKEYANGKTEFRAVLTNGNTLLEWFDFAQVAVKRANAAAIPRSVSRTILIYRRP